MAPFVDTLTALDAQTSAVAEGLRWGPLTVVFVLASTWWVKWPLLVAVGACGDASCRRRRIPCAFAAGLAAVGAAALLVTVLKALFDRARPPLADGIDPIGAVPASASFPSGHAATAFAAAVAVGLVHPRLRKPLLAMAAVVALSRVYLGVHYALDVVVGTLLGIAIGYLAARLVARAGAVPTGLVPSPAPGGTSFARRRR